MKVLFAVSEISPWIKTGGLADVAAALPAALYASGVDVRILIPSYPALQAAFPDAAIIGVIPPSGTAMHGAAIREAHDADGMPIYLLECHAYYDRPGSPYLGPDGFDWVDNGVRFGLLARAAALLAQGDSPLDWRPDILHCNDWQTALAPAFLRYRPHARQAKSLITIHNLAFHGLFGRPLLSALGLPEHAWSLDGVEYHGWISFLKAGLQSTDEITTVSPSYAREICTEAEGMGLDGLLQHRAAKLSGILNGIDTALWNPASDRHIARHYDAATLEAKAANRAALQAEMGLAARPELPVLGIVSRLTEQKGLDLVPMALARLLMDTGGIPFQMAVLGSGNKKIEATYRELAARFPGQIAVRLGFDEGLAHRIEAGADFFLMPSRFEPCGLNQMYSLRYGTLPIVRSTGGLADTVIDATDARRGNGFVFQEPSVDAMLIAIARAIATWHDPAAYRALQRRAMSADFSWNAPAAAYRQLYERML